MIKSMFYAGGKLIVVTRRGATSIAGEPESLTRDIESIIQEEEHKLKGLIFEKVFTEEVTGGTNIDVGVLPAGSTIFDIKVYNGVMDAIDWSLGHKAVGALAKDEDALMLVASSLGGANTYVMGIDSESLAKTFAPQLDVILTPSGDTSMATGSRIIVAIQYI